MKKKFVFSILLSLIISSIAGQYILSDYFPMKNGKVNYNEIVYTDTFLTGIHLYENAKKWIDDIYIDPKTCVQIDKPDSGLIIIKSYFVESHIGDSRNGKMWYLFKLEIHEGYYRYALYELIYQNNVNLAPFPSKRSTVPFERWCDYVLSQKISKNKRARREITMIKFYDQINYRITDLIVDLNLAMNTK